MQAEEKKKLIKDILRIVLVTAFFATAAYLLSYPSVRQIFDIDQWRTRSQTTTGKLTFIAVFSLAIGCGFPRTATSVFAGGLYGAVLGIVISQITTLIGATINFLMGRWVLRGPIKRRLPGRFRIWYDRFGENGFKWIFYVRLFPLSNAVAVNVLCGASRVRYLTFLGATFLGYLPFTVSFALFGSSAVKDRTFQLILAAAVFALVFLIRWMFKKAKAAEVAPVEEPPGSVPFQLEASKKNEKFLE